MTPKMRKTPPAQQGERQTLDCRHQGLPENRGDFRQRFSVRFLHCLKRQRIQAVRRWRFHRGKLVLKTPQQIQFVQANITLFTPLRLLLLPNIPQQTLCGWRGYEREEKEGEREVDNLSTCGCVIQLYLWENTQFIEIREFGWGFLMLTS